MKMPTLYPTPLEALTEVLVLALTAPDDERAARAGVLADDFVRSFNLSPAEVELAKARALKRWDIDPSRN